MVAPRVLLINHTRRLCGVYQFGLGLAKALAPSVAIDFHYSEIDGSAEFASALATVEPRLVIANHHPLTMSWLTRAAVRACPCPVAGIVHEFDHGDCFVAASELFTYRILPDPTVISRLPNLFPTPRLAPEFIPPSSTAAMPIIVGSFGFASGGKGFEHIVDLVQREFEHARIRLHMPPSAFADPDGAAARAIAARCRALVEKPGIVLDVSHDFLDEEALLDFLAGNSLNAFLYDDQPGRGVSSVVDLAVAAGRPVAVSDSRMFRALHAAAPGCRVAVGSLHSILIAGPSEILEVKAAWSPAVLRERYEAIVQSILAQEVRVGEARWNGVLDDDARARYASAIAEIRRLAPETMARKIPRANVQQAFVMEAVRALKPAEGAPRILCVGAFEDTACEALRGLGYLIDAIDPELNCDLDGFCRSSARRQRQYEAIFSTSVIEHVPDDELFLEQIRDLLAPGGVAILTLDFRDDWLIGDPKPVVDQRLYTNVDLLGRLLPLLHGCDLLDAPHWIDATPDFEYEGSRYGFATLVFRKRAHIDAAEVEFDRSLDRERVRMLRDLTVRQHATICALLYSRSWRVTEPLRKIAVRLGI
ncbi:MAG: methyltransferase domain-containing protein [Rhodocyclales bacterium]|nr:methyltransferase domain-containing protein [Rhodocyclales bacterium]